MKHLVVRGGAGFYYGPSAQMVSGSLEDSDGYSTSNNWNATCLNSDGNTVFNGTAQCNANVAGSVSSITGDYSLSNPFPVDRVRVFFHHPNCTRADCRPTWARI